MKTDTPCARVVELLFHVSCGNAVERTMKNENS